MQNKKSEITKNVLAYSLKKLLNEKPLNKISIKEIVSDSGLNRQTFYYHFDDIYDIVEWIFRKEAFSLFDNYELEQLWQDGLKEFLIYIDENRIICQNILNTLGNENTHRIFSKDIFTLVANAVDDLSEGYNISSEYKLQLTQFFAISFGSIIEHWTFNRLDQSVDELILFLDQIIQNQINGTAMKMEKL